MFARTLGAAALILTIANVSAGAVEIAPDGVEKAKAACTAMNQHGPVEVVKAVEDGMGDWIVWVKDKDADLWMCNASSAGAVYTNVMMKGDLLKGDGAKLLGFQPIADRASNANPKQVAENLCAAVGNRIEELQIVVTVEDGMGDYLTWLKNANEELWVCNASGEAKLYDFEAVDMPLNDFVPVESRTA